MWFQKHCWHTPASGPLYLLCPLPGSHAHQYCKVRSAHLPSVAQSVMTQQRTRPLRWALMDEQGVIKQRKGGPSRRQRGPARLEDAVWEGRTDGVGPAGKRLELTQKREARRSSHTSKVWKLEAGEPSSRGALRVWPLPERRDRGHHMSLTLPASQHPHKVSWGCRKSSFYRCGYRGQQGQMPAHPQPKVMLCGSGCITPLLPSQIS